MLLRLCSSLRKSTRIKNVMNKNESKYFNTAVKMDKAFLARIEKKDFAYITVKEICEKAGVNRSGNVVVKMMK